MAPFFFYSIFFSLSFLALKRIKARTKLILFPSRFFSFRQKKSSEQNKNQTKTNEKNGPANFLGELEEMLKTVWPRALVFCFCSYFSYKKKDFFKLFSFDFVGEWNLWLVKKRTRWSSIFNCFSFFLRHFLVWVLKKNSPYRTIADFCFILWLKRNKRKDKKIDGSFMFHYCPEK